MKSSECLRDYLKTPKGLPFLCRKNNRLPAKERSYGSQETSGYGTLGDDLGDPRCRLGPSGAVAVAGLPAQRDRSRANRFPPGGQRDHLPHVHRVPVESVAQDLRRRQFGTSVVPALGGGWPVYPTVGDLAARVRGPGWCGLAMASG